MRLLIYNIAYGSGHTGEPYDRIKNAHRFIKTHHSTIAKIANFIEKINPDITGLIEVDVGSLRTNHINQVEQIASKLKHHHISAIKYNNRHIASKLPILRHHANAILTKNIIPSSKFHFLPCGIKQLIIEAEINGLFFFLVHLSVRKNIRRRQLEQIAKIANRSKPLIIAGDFNTFSGRYELLKLQNELELNNANSSSIPTFPSYKPKRELDFILYSKNIIPLAFTVENVLFSDHLPLIFDFEIN